MKKFLIILLLAMVSGCYQETRTEVKRKTITAAYFSNERDWYFVLDNKLTHISWGASQTNPEPGPSIFNDVSENEEEYILTYTFTDRFNSSEEVVKEIHLRKKGEIQGGQEKVGKTTRNWNKVN